MNAVTEYRVNIQGVKEQFEGRIYEIDGNKSKRKIVEEMARKLALKDSNAPRKPPKIIMMGPPGVELTKHAKKIAEKYKLIFIDVDQMVKDCVRRQELAQHEEVRLLIKAGEKVPDDVIMPLLRQRLYMPDCKTNGWILMGAPTSIDQITILKELDQQPSLLISLDMSEHLIYEKLEQRRFDPLTMKYHFIFNENLTDEAILNRLVHNVEDTHAVLKQKMIDYRAFVNLIMTEYTE
jgi:adenylate kinase